MGSTPGETSRASQQPRVPSAANGWGAGRVHERKREKETDNAQLDFQNPTNNDFFVVNQFTVTGTKKPRRPDIVAFVNGLPLGIIELKNPADTNADVWKAYGQLQTYKDEIADLLVYNEALVVSDGMMRGSAC